MVWGGWDREHVGGWPGTFPKQIDKRPPQEHKNVNKDEKIEAIIKAEERKRHLMWMIEVRRKNE